MAKQMGFLPAMLSLLFLAPVNTVAQQIWTYDFRDQAEAVFDSGDSESFIAQDQTGGGTLRVRVSGNNDGRDIKISPDQNEVGTFSRLILDAAASGGRNIFEISAIDAASVAYFRARIKISAQGENNLEIFIGSDESAGNSPNLSRLFAGIRFSIEKNETDELIINAERKSGSSSGLSHGYDFGTDLVSLDNVFLLEIYMNNSVEHLEYSRDGQIYSLESDRQSYWINGNRIESGPSTTGYDSRNSPLEIGEFLSTIKFLGGKTDGGQASIEIDDIVYSNSLPDVRTIEGPAGWRMLAAPSDGFDIEQLSRQNMVQGVEGGSYPNATPNVYAGYEGDGGFTEAVETSSTLNRGNGFIWYLFDNDAVVESKPLPFDLAVAKNQPEGDVSVTGLNVKTDSDGFNLLGNPFSEGLDVSGISSWATGGSLQSAVVQVYDPSIQNYIPVNEQVAAFQGFFLENNDASGLIIPESAQSSEEDTFYKPADQTRLIAFQLDGKDTDTGTEYSDRALQLYFDEHSDAGWDLRDASKLYPLTSSHIGMAFVGSRDGESILKAQESRPFDIEQPLSIPVEFYSSGVTGPVALSLREMKNIPESWLVEIEDRQTEKRQILDELTSFTFEAELAAKINAKDPLTKRRVKATAEEESRFMLHITPQEDQTPAIPVHFTLHQNYPNPFNPVTTIRYDVPHATEVKLEVYDMLGRLVANIAEGQTAEGTHSVMFDAGHLSSGVYIYKLTAGQTVMTRKLTVLK